VITEEYGLEERTPVHEGKQVSHVISENSGVEERVHEEKRVPIVTAGKLVLEDTRVVVDKKQVEFDNEFSNVTTEESEIERTPVHDEKRDVVAGELVLEDTTKVVVEEEKQGES